MIKDILVPTSGNHTDDNVFATALAFAKPLAAHLDFYHVRFSECEALVRTPHADFCQGAAIKGAFDDARRHETERSSMASEHFQKFCMANQISMLTRPANVPNDRLSACLIQDTDFAEDRLIAHARHSDLTVVGRERTGDLLPGNLIEVLLLGSGRPIIIAPDVPLEISRKTIVIGWTESAEAARAVGAAIPLLEKAQSVILLGVAEFRDPALTALNAVKRQLAWHGIIADVNLVIGEPSKAREQLLRSAAEMQPGLFIAGAFGRGPWRELMFGGVTESLLEQADYPVFLMH